MVLFQSERSEVPKWGKIKQGNQTRVLESDWKRSHHYMLYPISWTEEDLGFL